MAAAAALRMMHPRPGDRGTAPALFGAEYLLLWEQQEEYLERRRLFLRSYHFCRKQAPRRERARRALLRVRRLVWRRLRAARRLPRLLWANLRAALPGLRKRGRPFHRLPPCSAGRVGSSLEWPGWP